jgi:hypothetical protein
MLLFLASCILSYCSIRSMKIRSLLKNMRIPYSFWD